MLKSKREKRICAKYGARDGYGYVHCNECPLNLFWIRPEEFSRYEFICKATHHYDRHKQEWVPDEESE